jgi:hypothetical protein
VQPRFRRGRFRFDFGNRHTVNILR